MALFVLIQEHCYTGQSSRIFSKRKANLSALLTCDLGVNDSSLMCILAYFKEGICHVNVLQCIRTIPA